MGRQNFSEIFPFSSLKNDSIRIQPEHSADLSRVTVRVKLNNIPCALNSSSPYKRLPLFSTYLLCALCFSGCFIESKEMGTTGTSLFLITYNYDYIIFKLLTYNELFGYIWCVIYPLDSFLDWLEMESLTFISCTNKAGMTRYQMH